MRAPAQASVEVPSHPEQTVTVIVPTYRRPDTLVRCLLALEEQTVSPLEVIVIVRSDDTATTSLLAQLHTTLNLRVIRVEEAGVVAALNAGLAVATGDLFAFTDDDAAPRPDWLSRIASIFEQHASVGGVGGRDLLDGAEHSREQLTLDVGRVQWFGRPIGNHHRGMGGLRQVDILKGVNMSFRRQAIEGLAFDTRLRGNGAQVHNEMAISLAVKKRGWSLVYDPRIVVDHTPAIRFDEDQRRIFDETALANAVHNETLVLLTFLPWYRKLVFALWAIFVGTRYAPGIAQLLWPLNGPRHRLRRVKAAFRGRVEGTRTWRSSSASAPASNKRSAVLQ